MAPVVYPFLSSACLTISTKLFSLHCTMSSTTVSFGHLADVFRRDLDTVKSAVKKTRTMQKHIYSHYLYLYSFN